MIKKRLNRNILTNAIVDLPEIGNEITEIRNDVNTNIQEINTIKGKVENVYTKPETDAKFALKEKVDLNTNDIEQIEQELNTFAKIGLPNTFTATNTFNESIDLANNNINNVAAPINDTDAANKAYVDAKVAELPAPDLSNYYNKAESDERFGLKTNVEANTNAIEQIEQELQGVAKLGLDNTFTANNTFNTPIVVANPTESTHAVNQQTGDLRYLLRTTYMGGTTDIKNITNDETIIRFLKEGNGTGYRNWSSWGLYWKNADIEGYENGKPIIMFQMRANDANEAEGRGIHVKCEDNRWRFAEPTTIANVANPTGNMMVANKQYVDSTATNTVNNALNNVPKLNTDNRYLGKNTFHRIIELGVGSELSAFFLPFKATGFTSLKFGNSAGSDDKRWELNMERRSPIINLKDPTRDYDAAHKKYVDDKVAGFVKTDTQNTFTAKNLFREDVEILQDKALHFGWESNDIKLTLSSIFETKDAKIKTPQGNLCLDAGDGFNILVSNKRIGQLAAPAHENDAANKQYVDTQLSNYATTEQLGAYATTEYVNTKVAEKTNIATETLAPFKIGEQDVYMRYVDERVNISTNNQIDTPIPTINGIGKLVQFSLSTSGGQILPWYSGSVQIFLMVSNGVLTIRSIQGQWVDRIYGVIYYTK